MLLDVGPIGGAAQQQVAQEVALVLVLDGGDGLLARDQQSRDGSRPLQGVHVVGGQRLVGTQTDQPGQVGATGSDPQSAHLADTHGRPVETDPLDPQPSGRVHQVVGVAAPRASPRAAPTPARARRSR